jgi:hypothetical protein
LHRTLYRRLEGVRIEADYIHRRRRRQRRRW